MGWAGGCQAAAWGLTDSLLGMASDYHLYLRREVLDFLNAAARRDRKIVWELLDYLERNPKTKGDFQEIDASGRAIEGLIVGKHAVVYWTDDAVREVKVVAIEFADH